MVSSGNGVIVARDAQGLSIGAMVLTGMQFSQRYLLHLRDVAVEESWRGQGVGALLVIMHRQVLPESVGTFGGCSEDLAGFYSKNGLTVFRPGTPFPFGAYTGTSSLMAMNPNPDHPCWFISDISSAGRAPTAKISRRTASARKRTVINRHAISSTRR